MARSAKAKPKRRAPSGKRKTATKDDRPWALWTLALLIAVLVLRLAINAAELIPVHFDEAQYWAYGQELAWGYFSKPPLVGAVIRVTTDLMGDTLFGLRLATPIAHALIAWLMFLTARRLFDGKTGFWAALAYTAAPGVTVSAMIVSTDPIMMVFWALALYAVVRAEAGQRRWWIVMGISIGLGILAKYTMMVFVAGLLAYVLFSAERRDWRGVLLGIGVALLIFTPNLLWNAENSFATVTHIAEDATPGGGLFNPGKLAEFLGAQLGVIGLVIFPAIFWALWKRRTWIGDPGMRLLAWQTVALLIPIIGLAFVTRAQPNWAAPAYVAGTIFAVRFLLMRDWQRALIWGQVGISAVAAVAVLGLAVLHASGPDWPRATDPFKKMRIGAPFCELALGAMAEEGVEVMLSNDRRRLSECMFQGALGWDEIAVWNPDGLPDNHHELVATLYTGDDRPMLLAVLGGGEEIAARFDQAREIESGQFATHGNREIGFELWIVEGFKGY